MKQRESTRPQNQTAVEGEIASYLPTPRLFLFFWAAPYGMQDPSSPTRDQT